MFSQLVELRGHIIDSLTLPKVLDEILVAGGNYAIREVKIGKERSDPSYALIEVTSTSPDTGDDLMRRLRPHGAVLVEESEAELVEAEADGVFPAGFHVTTNHPTFVRVDAKWIPVQPEAMDCGIAVNLETQCGEALKFYGVRKGMKFVVGHRGVRITPVTRNVEHKSAFEFMASSVSSEKPKGAIIREIAAEFRAARKSGGKVLVVSGPALVHTGAGEHFEKLIKWGYIQVLFAGNALAVHDIEHALYGTSLGVYLEHGGLAEEGHENHMRAINTIRGAGGIRRAVETGILTKGIMHSCIQHGVDFVLAGSIRDDGPLPDVITDALAAQKLMREKVEGVSIALMMGSMLHTIAVGNLLAARVKTICVDINPSVVTKLADRGSFQAVGLVTDIEPFLRELTEFLAKDN